MRILGLLKLDKFASEHADCRSWVSNWAADVKGSKWTNFHDIKSKYPSASFLTDNVVIFNVRGNNYRLETQVTYGAQVVAIRWIGTHAEYDRRNR